jgi:formamidopyrimidine-DNA glycosylase
VLRGVSRTRLLRTLTDNSVVEVHRRAKHAVLRLASGHRLVIQPRMTGSLVVADPPLDADQERYAVLVCTLETGHLFVYRDVRRLGTVWLLDEPAWAAYSGRIGPEPLDETFTPFVFAERLAGTRQAIKKAIMDQTRLAGVGNIYANEALFQARIDPSKPASTLSLEELGALHTAIRDVFERALASDGTTFRDYRTGTGEPGRFQLELAVYGRGGEPCTHCGRRLVTTHAIDGRATTLCAFCQR